MAKNKKNAVVEGLKQAARIGLFATVGAFLTALIAYANGLDLKAAMVGALVTVLTAVQQGWDKYVHENDKIKASGLVPF